MRAVDLRSGKSHGDENFPVASLLLAPEHRKPILAFYHFARAADDVADHPHLAPHDKLALLDRLEAGLDGASNEDIEAAELKATLAHRGLPNEQARALMQAFRQDVTTNRYHSWLELMDYCAHSAMPVGRFVLDVYGEPRSTRSASDAICAALQIINHLQDCAHDFRTLNRVYIPLDMLSEQGAKVEDIGAAASSRGLKRTIQTMAQRAERLIYAGETLSSQIHNQRLAREVKVIIALAKKNVEKLKTEDPLKGGGTTPKSQALYITIATLLRSLSQSSFFRGKRIADDLGI